MRGSPSAITSRIPTMTLTGRTSTPRKCRTCRQTCHKVRFLSSRLGETKSLVSEAKVHCICAVEDSLLLIVYLQTQFVLLCNKNTGFLSSFRLDVMSLCKVRLSSPLCSLISCYFLCDDDEGEIKSFCLQAQGLINKI